MGAKSGVNIMRFTPLEVEVLMDRLGLEDCYIDCFNELHAVEEIETALEVVVERVRGGEIDIRKLSGLEKQILEESVNGSSMKLWANEEPAEVRGKYTRAFNSIETKFGVAGLTVFFPVY